MFGFFLALRINIVHSMSINVARNPRFDPSPINSVSVVNVA